MHTAFRMVCDLCRSSKLFTETKRTTQTTISWRHFFASFQTELACLSSCLDEGKSFPIIFVLKIVSSVKWLDTSVDRIMRTIACRQPCTRLHNLLLCLARGNSWTPRTPFSSLTTISTGHNFDHDRKIVRDVKPLEHWNILQIVACTSYKQRMCIFII